MWKAGKILGLASPLLLASCALPDQNSTEHAAIQKTLDSIGGFLGGTNTGASGNAQDGKMVTINAVNIMIDGPHPSDPRWQGRLISQTSLYRFFDAHPRRSPSDYWPRIAIRVDDYSETLIPKTTGMEVKYMSQMPGASEPNIARPLECIKFTAVIWKTPKQSERIESVVHCNADIRMNEPTLSVGALHNYASLMSPTSMSSGQVRNFGPKSPGKLLPDYSQDDIRLYTTGQHLFSSLFTQLGYKGPLDSDPRLWFINLAQKPV